ncbi:MAG TPA: hypothetical protein VKN14_03725 [Flavobacteriaceae bacterium]|nr:hypothetical protein [Flavobacteriaceae bacterium]
MKTTQRSASYPSYTIRYSLDICTAIYKNYGTNYRASREELSEILGISVGNLTQKVSAAVQYGLLDLKSKEGYKVSDLFVKWFRPINDNQMEEALIEAFKSPTLYGNLIEVYENHIVPPLKPLSNILLQRHSISESACEKASGIFLENAQELELLDNENRLVFGKSLDVDYEEPDEEDNFNGIPKKESTDKVVFPQIIKKNNSNEGDNYSGNSVQDGVIINVLLNNRRTAQVILPKDVTPKDCDTIKDWIDMIRKSFN